VIISVSQSCGHKSTKTMGDRQKQVSMVELPLLTIKFLSLFLIFLIFLGDFFFGGGGAIAFHVQ